MPTREDSFLYMAEDFSRIFGDYLDPFREAEWEQIQEKFPLGSEVIGQVELIYPFGCFLKIEPGFPALLLITKIASSVPLVPNEYARVIQVGMKLTAKIWVYDGDKRQIGLTQIHEEE